MALRAAILARQAPVCKFDPAFITAEMDRQLHHHGRDSGLLEVDWDAGTALVTCSFQAGAKLTAARLLKWYILPMLEDERVILKVGVVYSVSCWAAAPLPLAVAAAPLPPISQLPLRALWTAASLPPVAAACRRFGALPPATTAPLLPPVSQTSLEPASMLLHAADAAVQGVFDGGRGTAKEAVKLAKLGAEEHAERLTRLEKWYEFNREVKALIDGYLER